jgi:hypothetical protein
VRGVTRAPSGRRPRQSTATTERELALAAVGGFLIIEGTGEALAPLRQTVGTQLVHDADVYFDRLLALGTEVVHPPIGRMCRLCARRWRWQEAP